MKKKFNSVDNDQLEKHEAHFILPNSDIIKKKLLHSSLYHIRNPMRKS